MRELQIGYIVKRFPRASETFIAQEILELERQGAEVTIFALRPNDTDPAHDWLQQIRARVLCYPADSFSEAWKRLQRRARRRPGERQRIHQALLAAFDHPQRSGRRYLAESLWIAEHAETFGIRHLHAHFANHPAFVAMLTRCIGRATYSFTAHAKDIFSAGPPPTLWRQQAASAEFVVTVSDANRNYLSGLLGRRLADKVRRLYNGVDLGRIQTGPRPLRQGTPRLLFVGRLIEKKGADVLLDALALLRRRGAPVPAVLVGEGEQAAALQQRAINNDLGGLVRFVGSLPHQSVIQCMRVSDLLVLPCRVAADGDRDALPTVLLEAMATGMPCISTPINGVPEIIDHQRNGLLVTENDPQALADAIAELGRDPQRRLALGMAARAKVERQFALTDNVAVLHGWFREVAHRGLHREPHVPSLATPGGSH